VGTHSRRGYVVEKSPKNRAVSNNAFDQKGGKQREPGEKWKAFQRAIIAAPATTDKSTAAIPPAGLPPRREERAPEKGVEPVGAAVPEEVEDDNDVSVLLTMFEVAAGVDVLPGVVTELEEPDDEDEDFEAVPEEVEEAEETLALDAPMEKLGVAANTSLMLPMLTASMVY